MPLDIVLTTRESRPSSTHQWADTGPSHQEASRPASPTRGADSRSMKTRISQPAGRVCQQKTTPYSRTGAALVLPTSRPMQPSGHPRSHIQLCQELHPFPHQPSDTTSGVPGPRSQTPGTNSAFHCCVVFLLFNCKVMSFCSLMDYSTPSV